jgi:transcriptional regulator with XRE-family HTH domain
MKAELVAEYLSALRQKTGLTFEAIAEKSNRSLSTVKNLCNGKTEDPRLDTFAPIVYAMGGSIDEMYNPEKNKDEIKETSVVALKDSYEYQMLLVKEAYDEQISNIRAHYEQHHDDLKENYEKRLADKREILESYKEYIKTAEKECLHNKIAFWICCIIFIGVLIAEVMNPNLGWLRY